MPNPFLVENHKTELRIFVVITSIFPTIRAYVSKSLDFNYVKYGMTNFTLDPNLLLKNRCTYCNTPKCQNMGYINGTNWFRKFYKLHLSNNKTRIRNIEKQMEEIVRIMLFALQRNQTWINNAKMQLYNNYNAYQKYSFDFFLDDQEKILLNEINACPGLPVKDGRLNTATYNLAGYHLPPNLNMMQLAWLGKCLNTIEPNEFLFNEKLYELEIPADVKQNHLHVLRKVRTCFPCTKIQWNEIMLEILRSTTPTHVKFLLLTYDETTRTEIEFKRILPIDPWKNLICKDIYQRLNYYTTFLIKDFAEVDLLDDDRVYYYLQHEAWAWKYGTKKKVVDVLKKLALKKYHLI